MTNEELVSLIQSGAEEYMGQLWEQVAGLVKWKAIRVINALDGGGGVEFDDLYDSGYLALVESVKTYKPGSATFSTWFMFYLKTAFSVITGYRTKAQREDPIRHAFSLDAPLTDDPDSGTLGEIISDPGGESGLESVEKRIYLRQLHEAVEEILNAIPEQDADIIRRRFYQEQTYEEAAKELGVASGTVSVRESQALRRMRRTRKASLLLPFYDADYNFFAGSGYGAFYSSGMSVQERYLINLDKEEERERRRIAATEMS